MIVCGDCGGENRKNARFCSWCGLRLALRCAVCATDILPGAEFCDACGTPVGEPAEAPAPLGARKVVTVLFADLAGSTSQHEQMDPESVRGFMDAYYAVVRDAVEGEGGRVVKLMGDGVMAAFGVPRVAEDDAIRAVRGAAAIQRGFIGLADRARQQFGTPVSLRIGVNTGEVVVAVGDNDVVGDAVNVAARLEAAAGPGEVIVGEGTWRLARDSLTLEALPPLTVKGKAEPVRAFRLVSVEVPSSAVRAGATSFVGRDNELARLVGFFDDAVAARATRVVSVIGSPGVGKSRLSRELATALASRAQVLEAGCPPAGGATFAPIADILREAAGIAEEAPGVEAREAVVRLLRHNEPDRDRVADRAVTLLGSGAPASPDELFWAIRRVLAGMAAAQPVVVILDDIHWAEPMLLDLIEHLGEWGRDGAVLLVVLARPEVRDLRPALADGGRRVAGVIVLEGLGGDASHRLARDLLGAGELPTAIAGKVLAVTQGNPLFLRELVRMLVDDGVLIRVGHAWETSIDAAELEVPPTVQALLSARIERLDADERIILERAAVIGSQFPRSGIAAIAPATAIDDIDQHLETLRRRELVEPDGSYWGDEPLYRFHHVLIRDAAYRGLLRETRADLHERYADWLEAKAADAVADQAEVLGLHLERAHEERQQLGGESRPELGARAARWLGIAGRRALERDDVGAAAGLLGRALDRIPDDDAQRPSLLIDRAEAVLAAGDVTTGAACVQVLQTLAGGSERLRSWAECFTGQLANLTDPSRLHSTVTDVAAAADRLTAIDDFAGAAKAHGVRAQALARLGRIAECEAALDKALAAARQAGDLRRANNVLAGAPLAALWGPSPVARASGKCLDVVRVLRITSGSPAVEATALRCQAVLEALRGRDEAARRMLAAARASLEELGLRSGLLETDVFAGLVDLLADDPVAAEGHLRRAHDGFRELGVDVEAAQSGALLARALLGQGRDDEALALTVESEALGGEDLKTAIAWRSARAEALARRGDTTDALMLARHAVTLASPTDLVIDHADACTALATVLRLAGRTDEATEQTRQAADLYDRKGATAAVDATVVERPPAPVSMTNATVVVPPNQAARIMERRFDATARGRWDEVADLVADEITLADHRAGLHTARGQVAADVWVDELRYIFAVPIEFDIELVATRGQSLCLHRQVWTGEHPRSGPFSGEALAVYEVDQDRIVAAVQFEADALDDAFTELDSRYLRGEGAAWAEYIAPVQLWHSLFNARAWTDFDRVWADDFRLVDHRPAGWGELDGTGYRDVLSEMADLAPDIHSSVRTLNASPGRVVTLVRAAGTAVTGGPIEINLVMDCKVTDGRIVRLDNYPPEQATPIAAREEELTYSGELDESYAADLPPNLAAAFLAALAVPQAFNDGEVERLLELANDGFRLTDHTPYGFGELDAAGWGRLGETLAELAPDTRMHLADVELSENAVLFVLQFSGSGLGGGPTEMTVIIVGALRNGRYDSVDRYSLDQRDIADRRFEELRAAAPSSAVENAVTRLYAPLAGPNWVESHWPAFVAIHAEDVIVEARTAAGERYRTVGRDAAMAEAKSLYDIGLTKIVTVPLCVRGARLALISFLNTADRTEHGGGAADVEQIAVCETDDAGLVSHVVIFEPRDLDHAITELDERYLAGEAAEFADSYRRAMRTMRLLNARDWPEWTNLFSPDLVYVDHSPARFGTCGRDEFVRLQRDYTELAPDTRWTITAVHALTERQLVIRVQSSGSGLGGGLSEISRLNVVVNDGDICLRCEAYPVEELAAARRRFEELTALPPETPFARAVDALTGAANDRALDAVLDTFAADLVALDHPLRAEFGRDAFADDIGRLARMPGGHIEADIEASLGQRHGVVRWTASYPAGASSGPWADVGGGGTSRIAACRVGLDGRLVRCELFGAEDLLAALIRAEELYAEDEAAGRSLDASRIRLALWRSWQAYGTDWDIVAAAYAPDLATHDHRRAGPGSMSSRDEFLVWARSSTAVVEHMRGEAIAVHLLSDEHVVFSMRGVAEERIGGGRVEFAFVGWSTLGSAGVTRLETFALEAVDAALAAAMGKTGPI